MWLLRVEGTGRHYVFPSNGLAGCSLVTPVPEFSCEFFSLSHTGLWSLLCAVLLCFQFWSSWWITIPVHVSISDLTDFRLSLC